MATMAQMLSNAYQTISRLAVLGNYWLRHEPRPRYAGQQKLKGLTAPVEILRDRWGVPHIYAHSTADVLFAQGYVHAQERLFQMDINRRMVAGRLSEILGAAAVPLDRWMRTLTMRRVAESEVELITGAARPLIDAYCAGVNTAIQREPLPLEFRLLGYQPEIWISADSLAWVKMMCWTLCVNWETEILRAQLIGKLGPDIAATLEPIMGAPWARVIPPDVDYSCIGPESLKRAAQARQFTGPGARQGIGSNNWVLAGNRTTTGQPILANDMHLGMTAPAIWIENHLEGGDLHVTGVSLPGLPAVIAGHNAQVAWGFTNGFPDVQDLYIEHLHKTPEGRVQSEFRGEWRDAEVIREEIRVKDAAPVYEEVVLTRHGPIINALIANEQVEPHLALRWTALDHFNALETVLAMNRADSCVSFREAVRGWLCPTQNMVYADRQGNIGYSFPGNVPVRAKGDGSVPVPGWTGEYEWTGYIPFEELPHMYNPMPGYIATANNRVVDDSYPHWVSADFCTSSRATRIVEMIEQKVVLSVEDIKRMQMDQISVLARATMHLLDDIESDDPELANVFKALRGWDGHLSPDSPQAALYEVFSQRLLELLTTPRLGELAIRYAGEGPTPVLAEGSMFGEHAREWLLTTLSDSHSPWWEIGDRHNRVEHICQAMREAVEILKQKCGPRLEDWRWGKIHGLIFGHTLGSVKPLDTIFNRGPFALGGDGDTVWATGTSRVDLSNTEMVGPPFRFIADLSDWNNSQGILVPGQSGHPASPHYDNNIAAFIKGDYHPMLFDRDRVQVETVATLILEPRQL